MRFLCLAASHRPASHNLRLAKLAAGLLIEARAQAETVDYADLDMPLYNDDICERSGVPDAGYALARRAHTVDGIVLASPEYNWSYPGSLKNMLDWTSRIPGEPLGGKTALLLSATPGPRGGILGLSHLRTPLDALGLHVFPKVFPLGNAPAAFEGGKLADAARHDQLAELVRGYVDFTRKLREA